MGEPDASVTIAARGPFSLAASARFLEGFDPAAHDGASADAHLHLAFPVEGNWNTVGACVRENGHGQVVADLDGDTTVDPDAVHAQLARILSLDIDGTGFPDVGDRDTVIADLQARYPGLRPVCFYSPYEAACWAIIGHRIRITQAAAIKQRIAQHHGTTVAIHGDHVAAFPAPGDLRGIAGQLDLPDVKRERLTAIAEAALDGRLDGARLRSQPADDALGQLRQLPGIGPFSAELTLLRGAGHPDHTPTHERRLLQATATLYDIDDPSIDDLAQRAHAWRPFRTWCAVLIRTWFADQRR
ncbi:DNA-3-methyladenine glycosylase [soil metagenome]